MVTTNVYVSGCLTKEWILNSMNAEMKGGSVMSGPVIGVRILNLTGLPLSEELAAKGVVQGSVEYLKLLQPALDNPPAHPVRSDIVRLCDQLAELAKRDGFEYALIHQPSFLLAPLEEALRIRRVWPCYPVFGVVTKEVTKPVKERHGKKVITVHKKKLVKIPVLRGIIQSVL